MYIYQYELSEYWLSEAGDVIMSEVNSQDAARADILSVRGVESVTEAVVPSPQVVDVRGPPLIVVRQVWWTGGMEDLTIAAPSTETPLVLVSDIDCSILIILRIAIQVNRVRLSTISIF